MEAGKTTTIKMLTGVHAATGGEAFIFGQSIRSSRGMNAIRKSLGFCPQHDVRCTSALTIYVGA